MTTIFLWLNFFLTKIFLWLKTLRKSQNAALRTYHQLSNVSNCSFKKCSEKKLIFFRACAIFLTNVTTVTAVTTVIFFKLFFLLFIFFFFFYSLSIFGKSNWTHLTTNVMFWCTKLFGHYCHHCHYCHYCHLSKKIYIFFRAFLERAIWHIWQPMWCFQSSVVRFLRCFSGDLKPWSRLNCQIPNPEFTFRLLFCDSCCVISWYFLELFGTFFLFLPVSLSFFLVLTFSSRF